MLKFNSKSSHSLLSRCGLRAVLAVCLLSLYACVPALPPEEPEEVMGSTLVTAEKAAAEAQGFAEESKLQATKCEQALFEAQELLRKAEAAQNRCQELVNKIPKPKKKSRRRRRSAKSAKKKPAKKPSELEYSPSDAPLTQ